MLFGREELAYGLPDDENDRIGFVSIEHPAEPGGGKSPPASFADRGAPQFCASGCPIHSVGPYIMLTTPRVEFILPISDGAALASEMALEL